MLGKVPLLAFFLFVWLTTNHYFTRSNLQNSRSKHGDRLSQILTSSATSHEARQPMIRLYDLGSDLEQPVRGMTSTPTLRLEHFPRIRSTYETRKKRNEPNEEEKNGTYIN
jgi:hypothetical protein